MICKICGKETIKDWRKNKKSKHNLLRFCSRSCANTRNFTSEQNKKKGLCGPNSPSWKGGPQIKTCKFCGINFISNRHNRNVKFCSNSCSAKNRYKYIDKNSYKVYKEKCRFNFNLANYPEEFDFSLIEKHGKYKAKNHGNNLDGISRDHMLSVKFGYENNIEPAIIKHPANCKLVVQRDNSKKGTSNSLSLVALKERISSWEKKYGRVV